MKPKRDTEHYGGSHGMANNTNELRERHDLRRERDGKIPPANDPDDRHHQRQRTCPHCHLPIADCECQS